jgi:integrase
MATIYLTLSTKVDNFTQKREILIRFSHGKINQRGKTNIFIPEDSWNSENQQIIIPNIRVMSNEKTELKQYLTEQSEKLNTLLSVINTSFNEMDKSNVPGDWLKVTIDKFNFPEKYIPKVETVKNTTFFQFVSNFLADAPNRRDKKTGIAITRRTILQYYTTEKHLIGFAESLKKLDFEFSEIDQSFYDKFVGYLQKLDYGQNSVGKDIKVVKTILNEATIQGYNTNNYYNSFHVFKEDVDNIYLNEDELQLIKDVDFSNNQRLDQVRDWFLLLSWTGCRFSDLEKITKTDIKGNCINFRQEKTNTKVVIPLHPVVREILEKYNYNLPTAITNQNFNNYIKEVCEIAEIKGVETITRTVGGKRITETYNKWELVASHTGRRSFCTNMYLRGIQTLTIMSISGHKTEKNFLKYIKVSESEHAELMLNAWNKIYK